MAVHTMEEKYKTLKVGDLRAILASRGCTENLAKVKKGDLIKLMLEMDEADRNRSIDEPAPQPAPEPAKPVMILLCSQLQRKMRLCILLPPC